MIALPSLSDFAPVPPGLIPFPARRVGIPPIGLTALARKVCAEYGLRLDRVIGPARRKETPCVVARRIIIHTAVRRWPRASYASIAAVIGCDHTTLIYALRRSIYAGMGDPARDMAILRMRRQGLTTQTIVNRIGVPRHVVLDRVLEWRRTGILAGERA